MSNLKNKVIITAALTGALTPKGYKIPETPDEIAEDAYKCWKAGASVVHIHTRCQRWPRCYGYRRFSRNC